MKCYNRCFLKKYIGLIIFLSYFCSTMLASSDLTGIRKMSKHQAYCINPASTAAAAVAVNIAAGTKFDRSRNLTLKSKSSRAVEPLGRSSLRSKGSSNSSEDRVKLFKNCVRKMFLFLFTQIGVGAFVVFYTICGALIFQVCTYAFLKSNQVQIMS